MADSLALSITVPLSHLQAFMGVLAAHLEPDTPCSDGQLRQAAESGAERALSLRFPPDAALAAFAHENPDIACSVPGQVAVGYLFATVRPGAEALEITLYTSSRSVVAVLRESEHVRSLLVRLASLGEPKEVRITDEWNDVTTLLAHREA